MKAQVMTEDNAFKTVRNLMKELNAEKAMQKILEQQHNQLQCEVASKEHELQNLHEVHKRKQQPNLMNTQKKQKKENDGHSTNPSSYIDQETNIECDISSSTSNINNIQQDENIDISSGTTTIHNIHQDEIIQNAETGNALPLHDQQLGR